MDYQVTTETSIARKIKLDSSYLGLSLETLTGVLSRHDIKNDPQNITMWYHPNGVKVYINQYIDMIVVECMGSNTSDVMRVSDMVLLSITPLLDAQ